MGWDEVDNKMKRHIDSLFVSCTEKYERDTIKRIIREEFPHITEPVIDKAIDNCCQTIEPPRPRDKFFHCLSHKLFGASRIP